LQWVSCHLVLRGPTAKLLIAVIATVVQSYITHDTHILSIDRKVRLVSSTTFVFLPFIPIPIVLIALLLEFISPGGRCTDPEATKGHLSMDLEKKSHPALNVLNASVELASDGLTLAENDSVHGKDNRQWIRVKGEPKSGFGLAPVLIHEILETAAVIVVPAVLLTIEQGIRCAQAYYVPEVGAPIPWVSILHFVPFMTSDDFFYVVHDKSCFLDLHLWFRDYLSSHIRARRSS
jgi:hypothetical protein